MHGGDHDRSICVSRPVEDVVLTGEEKSLPLLTQWYRVLRLLVPIGAVLFCGILVIMSITRNPVCAAPSPINLQGQYFSFHIISPDPNDPTMADVLTGPPTGLTTEFDGMDAKPFCPNFSESGCPTTFTDFGILRDSGNTVSLASGEFRKFAVSGVGGISNLKDIFFGPPTTDPHARFDLGATIFSPEDAFITALVPLGSPNLLTIQGTEKLEGFPVLDPLVASRFTRDGMFPN
jgi:hypothetical protein